MQKLSLKKQLTIVQLYLAGLSYDEIAARCGVSKGTVANVIADLKAGRILDVQAPLEQLEQLRELAVDLRRLKLTPGQAVVGVAALSHLQELEIEPADIQRWAATCRELTGEGAEVQAFVRAAVALEEVRERTGLSVEALEAKVRSLEEEEARLQPLVQELKQCQRQLKELEKRRQALANEVSELEKRRDPLRKDLANKERRESQMSRRVIELEERAHSADERLARSRVELKMLAELGLSSDDFPGFVHRLSAVAQRHGINTGALRDRLLQEIETLDAVVGLEACLKRRQDELNDIEHDIAKARQERKSEDHALKRLRQQQAKLHAAIAQEQAHLHEEMKATAQIAGEATANLRQDLERGIRESLLEVYNLRDQAFQLGQELGRCNAIVEANQWLQTLVSLIKGDGELSAENARTVSLKVLRGLKDWMQRNQNQVSQSCWLTTQLGSLIEELEGWKISPIANSD